MTDAGGTGSKAWTFDTNSSAASYGLQVQFEDRDSGTTRSQANYTWTLDSMGRPYMATTIVTLEPGGANAVQKRTDQVLDQYGNVTSMSLYDFGASSPARTYSNTYLSDASDGHPSGSNYGAEHINNRLLTSAVRLQLRWPRPDAQRDGSRRCEQEHLLVHRQHGQSDRCGGNRKKFTMDAFGNLVRVDEPDASQTAATATTTYTYDALNHLTVVTMKRQMPGGNFVTQMRTFNYVVGSSITAYLQSAANPENGTVSYTYSSDGSLATKAGRQRPQLRSGGSHHWRWRRGAGLCVGTLNMRDLLTPQR